VTISEFNWEDVSSPRGPQEWRLRLPQPVGRRKYVRVFSLSNNEVQAESISGYVRRCVSVEEAKAYLEQTIIRFFW